MPQVQLVDLPDQVGAVAVMRLLVDQREPAGQVDPAGGNERIVRPQPHPRIAGSPSERDTLVDELRTDPVPTPDRVDQQDPELRSGVVGWHAEHAPGSPPVELGDPATLELTASPEIGDDAGDQRLEGRVPAVLRRIDLAVSQHHPAQISRLADLTYHDP